jgi:hypothetical protein
MGAHQPNPLREARAGLLTLVVVLGVSTLLIVLSGIDLQRRITYRLGFTTSQNATGIEEGTPVTMGGIPWGQVVAVTSGALPPMLGQPQADAGNGHGTLVTFELDARIQLWPAAKIARQSSILGGDVQLVILNTGQAVRSSGLLGLGFQESQSTESVLRAVDGGGMAGLLGADLADKIERLPDDFEAMQQALAKGVRDRFNAEFEPIQASFQAIRARLRGDLDRWEPMFAQARSGLDALSARWIGPSGVQATVEGGADRIETQWKRLAAELDELQTRVSRDLEPRLEVLARRAMSEWERLGRLRDQLSPAVDDAIGSYRRFMADSSLMGGQLGLLFDDVVGSLLKALLGKPGEDGMARWRRFEAASRLAVATSDLREANEALERLAGSAQGFDPALAREIRDKAIAAEQQFRDAVARLMLPLDPP